MFYYLIVGTGPGGFPTQHTGVPGWSVNLHECQSSTLQGGLGRERRLTNMHVLKSLGCQ